MSFGDICYILELASNSTCKRGCDAIVIHDLIYNHRIALRALQDGPVGYDFRTLPRIVSGFQMTVDVTAIVTCMTDAERPFLQEALESVRRQTLPCEAIVVVLESNTWIGGLVAESPHVRVMRRPPGWEGAARHTGITAATTEFVAFLDGDDVWLPTKTKKQVELLRDSGGTFAGVDHMLMTEEGRPFAFGLARYIAMPSAWMVRRETMLRYPFDPTLAVGADGEWWRSTWSTVPKFRIPEPLIKYRVRRQSLSNATPSKRRKAALAKLSELPTARPLLLAATCVLHKALQRPDYVPLNEWQVSKTKA